MSVRGVPSAAATTEDADLLSRAVGGDQLSWNVLIERHGPMVRAVAKRHRLDSDTVADVCQTVWLRLYENASHIRNPEALGGWLATTTRNEALHCIRGLQRSRPVGALTDEVDRNTPAPDERAIDEENLAAALHALRLLSDESRQLIRLLVASPPLSYQVIAEQVGRPVGSIGPTRSRCLEALRSHMTEPVPALAA